MVHVIEIKFIGGLWEFVFEGETWIFNEWTDVVQSGAARNYWPAMDILVNTRHMLRMFTDVARNCVPLSRVLESLIRTETQSWPPSDDDDDLPF